MPRAFLVCVFVVRRTHAPRATFVAVVRTPTFEQERSLSAGTEFGVATSMSASVLSPSKADASQRLAAAAKNALNRTSVPHRGGPKHGGTFHDIVKGSATAFVTADKNDDQVLTFEEFLAIVPEDMKAQHTMDTLRETFDMADANSDGTVSLEEYFFWTLTWAANNSGAAIRLQECFAQYDTTGDGKLNLREFCAAVATWGYGDLGHKIFRELDTDLTGTVSYQELLSALKTRRGNYSTECRQLLTAMSFQMESLTKAQGPGRILDVPKCTWVAESVTHLRETMREFMHLERAKPWDVWCTLMKAANAKRRMNRTQFLKSMRTAMSCDASDKVLEGCFDEMDDDQCGEVYFDEFLNWASFRPQRRRRVRTLRLYKDRPEDRTPLDNMDWTPAILRDELQEMLQRSQNSALDLLSAHDKSEDGDLSEREFLGMVKTIIGSSTAWTETNVRDVAKGVFARIAGDDAHVSIEELERWLVHGWKPSKAQAVTVAAAADGLGESTASVDETWRDITVADRVVLRNPEFTDGTRLRDGPSTEAKFNGQHILNGEAVDVCEVTPTGFARVQLCESDRSAEGWVVKRHLTTRGQVHVANDPAPDDQPPASSPRTELVLASPRTGLMRPMSTSLSLPMLETRSPPGAEKALALGERYMTLRTARLKASASAATQAAQRAEAIARRLNVAAEYARASAIAVADEQKRMGNEQLARNHSEAVRRRRMAERGRREQLRVIPGSARSQAPAKSPPRKSAPMLGRVPTQSCNAPGLVQVGVPSRDARPFW